jgi:hypothetical protein
VFAAARTGATPRMALAFEAGMRIGKTLITGS